MSSKFLSAVLALLAAGVVAVYLWLAAGASPVFGGPALAGVALGEYETGVRIAGQHLSCAASPGGPAACTLEVAGQTLRVEAAYGDEDRRTMTRCEAAYGGRTTPCEAAPFTVQGPAFAGVRDLAALGLTPAAVQALAARYPGSSWNEAVWTWIGFLAGLLAAALLGVAVGGWVVGDLRDRRFWITVGLSTLACFFALTIGMMTVLSGLALVD